MSGIFDRRATQSDGMHRRSNAAGLLPRACMEVLSSLSVSAPFAGAKTARVRSHNWLRTYRSYRGPAVANHAPISADRQKARERTLDRSTVSLCQGAHLPEDQNVIESKELESDLARDVQSCFPPILNRHIAHPFGPGRGNHGQNRLLVARVERGRRDDQRGPPFDSSPISERKGYDNQIERLKDHATLPRPPAMPIPQIPP